MLTHLLTGGVTLLWSHYSIQFGYESAVNDSNAKRFWMRVSVHGILSDLYSSSFKFPFYSERPSNYQTTAVHNIKAASSSYLYLSAQSVRTQNISMLRCRIFLARVLFSFSPYIASLPCVRVS